jgi:hypothetical protein
VGLLATEFKASVLSSFKVYGYTLEVVGEILTENNQRTVKHIWEL